MESKSNWNASGTNGSSPVDSPSPASTESKLASAAHGVVDRLADATDQATRNIKPVMAGVFDAAHKTVDRAADAAGSAANWASEKTANLQQAGGKFRDGTSAYVAAQPLKALAIAVAVGILIGKAVR